MRQFVVPLFVRGAHKTKQSRSARDQSADKSAHSREAPMVRILILATTCLLYYQY